MLRPSDGTAASPAGDVRRVAMRVTASRRRARPRALRGRRRRARDRRDRAGRRRSRRRRAAGPRRHGDRATRRPRMKYVDEFRDAELGRALAGEILVARRARPPLQGDGGLRRAHALDLQVRRSTTCCPPNVELVHGPGLPGLRDPDGPRRRRHRARPRARRDLHLLRRHDARARAPTARCSTPRPRAPTSAWSTRRSTRCGSRRPNPDREVVFFAIGFETTAPSTALTLKRAKAEGVANFFVHVQPRDDRAAAARAARLARPAPRRLHRPGPRLDRRRRPPVRVHPGRLRQADRRLGLRAARHPAGDPDDPQRSWPRAAARSRTSTSASSPTRATCARSR